MTPRQKRIYKDPEKAVAWATKHGQRFPEAESVIATDPKWAYEYAYDVIVGRFPEGEPAIATRPLLAYHYAHCVIKDHWPEAESVIATDPFSAHRYAINVLKGRFPEAEAVIATDPEWAKEYLKAFPEAKLEWVMNGWLDWLDL